MKHLSWLLLLAAALPLLAKEKKPYGEVLGDQRRVDESQGPVLR